MDNSDLEEKIDKLKKFNGYLSKAAEERVLANIKRSIERVKVEKFLNDMSLRRFFSVSVNLGALALLGHSVYNMIVGDMQFAAVEQLMGLYAFSSNYHFDSMVRSSYNYIEDQIRNNLKNIGK